MKDKIGFNAGFAILAFPIGLALYKDTNFNSWTFRKPALDIFYLIIFVAMIYFMLKKQNKKPGK
jgi:cbb3-type cytochrome oxidase subunit 1